MDYADKTKEELISEILLARQVEAGAKRSEEIYRKAFFVSADSVNINRLSDGFYISVNEGFVKMMGYSEEEVSGKTSVDLKIWVNPEDRFKLVAALEKSGKVESFEADFRRKDGSVINGSMSATIIDIDGVLHILNITKDITGQKQTKKELEQERYLIDALIDNLTDYIYIKDREGNFLKINNSQAKLLGLDHPDQVIGKSDKDFFSQEHAGVANSDEQYVVSTGNVVSKEEKLTREGLPDIWVLTTKMPLRDGDGIIIGSFGISKDITEKKNLEEALHLKQVMLEAIIDNSPDQIFYKDRNSRFIFCNKPVALLAGCESEEDMKGKSDFDFYPEHMARQYYNDEQTLMKIGEPLLNHEEQVIDKKTGEIKWNLSSKVPVRDSEGQVIGLAGFNRDITIKKRTELENQVLYEISQGYTMSDNLENFLSLIHGSLSKIVYAENCFVALYDQNSGLFSFPYFVDKYDTVPLPTSMLKSCTAYVLRKGKPFLFSQDAFDHLVELNEVELVGSASPSWIGIPLHTHSQTIGVLVLQHYEKENVYSEKDVKILMLIGRQIAIAIERKKAEEEIKIKNELLEAINIEKDKFFSIIAHDLRGPIGSFVTATQIIEDDLQNMTLDEIRDLTISMKTEATNLYRLLENLLEWSRLKRGVMEFSPARLNLLSEINSAIESVSELGRQKGIAISVSVRYELEITADKHMLQTIIRNLVANGVKFTRGGGKVTVTAMRNDDGSVEITVIDTGIGMTEDMKHRLFIMNEKTGRKGTDGEPSSGLGLLLCKEFVEKHKGKILVESEVDKGSSFKILIP